MENIRKVHCFFEQSGTFKNQFVKLGIPAEDYDIQNNFGETDHTDDLFAAIEAAYNKEQSLFDNIKGGEDGDLIMAFFPCIMFSCIEQMNITLGVYENQHKTTDGAGAYIIDRVEKREYFYKLLLKLCFVCIDRKIRLIIENPYTTNTYLKGNFIKQPSLIDTDRTRRGDYFVKPTAFWFFNCEPTHGETFEPTSEKDRKYFVMHSHQKHHKDQAAKGSGKTGLCSEERSMLSPAYACNFIHDFILGKPKAHTQLKLFDK